MLDLRLMCKRKMKNMSLSDEWSFFVQAEDGLRDKSIFHELGRMLVQSSRPEFMQMHNWTATP